jgi:hypothetical protein
MGGAQRWRFRCTEPRGAVQGGPFPLQVWQRNVDGDFVRVYAGSGPCRSPTLGAFLVVTEEGRKLRIADDEDATKFWMTSEEAAVARVAELEAALAAAKR